MKGIGSAPLGSSLFGSGTIDEATSVTSELYPGGEAPSFTSGGDTPLDSYGRPTGWTQVKSKVYLAVLTERGSSAVSNFGRSPFPLVIRDDTAEQVKASIRKTLDPMVKAKEISIDNIEIVSGGERLSINIFFTDLKTRRKDSVSVPKG